MTRRRSQAPSLSILAVLLVAAACGADASTTDGGTPEDGGAIADAKEAFAPGPTLTLGSTGQNEDPAVLALADGRVMVAWYSNRGGLQENGVEDKEIWVSTSSDGIAWSAPVAATDDASWAFTPSLAQSPDGRIHLAFWRVKLLPEGCAPGVNCTGTDNRIAVSSSVDGVVWTPAEEVTTGPGDWLPSLFHDGDGLRVVFAAVARDATGRVDLAASVTRLFTVAFDGETWSGVTPLTGLDAGGRHDTYPQVVRRGEGGFAMAWTRYDATAGGDVLAVVSEPSTDTWTATSDDGVAWTALAKASGPGVDAFPHLYETHDGEVFVTWITGATDPASTVEVPLGGAWKDHVGRPQLEGYTARVVATASEGVLLGAWVSGQSPTQQVDVRLFRRD